MQCCRTKVCSIGQLKRRVEIQVSDRTQNDFNEEILSWKTIGVVWARIQPKRRRAESEFESSNQLTAEITHEIMIRYRAGLTQRNRIKFGSRVFDINLVRNIFEENRFMELLCREVIE